MIRGTWGERLRQVFAEIPDPLVEPTPTIPARWCPHLKPRAPAAAHRAGGRSPNPATPRRRCWRKTRAKTRQIKDPPHYMAAARLAPR